MPTFFGLQTGDHYLHPCVNHTSKCSLFFLLVKKNLKRCPANGGFCTVRISAVHPQIQRLRPVRSLSLSSLNAFQMKKNRSPIRAVGSQNGRPRSVWRKPPVCAASIKKVFSSQNTFWELILHSQKPKKMKGTVFFSISMLVCNFGEKIEEKLKGKGFIKEWYFYI